VHSRGETAIRRVTTALEGGKREREITRQKRERVPSRAKKG